MLVAPNLAWQYEQGWPTLDFISNVREGMRARVPKPLFVAGQLLYLHPLTLPVWAAGLGWLLRGNGRRYGVLGWLFLTVLVTLLITGAKPYYLAPAYPALFAAGGVALERWLGERLRPLAARVLVAGWAFAAMAFAFPLALPILALPTIDAWAERLFGWAVPARALTHDLHDEYGWPHQARRITRLIQALPAEERARAPILVGNYGQASALAFFGPRYGLPRPLSAHMTHHLWARPERLDQASVVLAYGVERDTLQRLFTEVRPIGTIDHPLAASDERNLTVFALSAGARFIRASLAGVAALSSLRVGAAT